MERTFGTLWQMAGSFHTFQVVETAGNIRGNLRRLKCRVPVPIWRISLSTPRPTKDIKVPTTRGKTRKGKEVQAIVTSTGGRNTKIHAIGDGLGNPLALLLSPGNDHDSRHAVSLIGQAEIRGSNVIGDKAYGSQAIREYITSREGSYTIPPKSDNPEPWFIDEHVYKERHLIECFFQKIK